MPRFLVHAGSAVLVVVVLSAAGCMAFSVPARRPARSPAARPAPPTSTELAAMARAVILRANAVRAEVRAPALREAPALMTAAQQYAYELARLRRLEHTSPTPGRTTMTQRIEAAGVSWQRAAENLALISLIKREVPRNVIELWLRSSGHRRNLLDAGYTTTGVGVARDSRGLWYVVQLYVLPPPRR